VFSPQRAGGRTDVRTATDSSVASRSSKGITTAAPAVKPMAAERTSFQKVLLSMFSPGLYPTGRHRYIWSPGNCNDHPLHLTHNGDGIFLSHFSLVGGFAKFAFLLAG
jgi:hypothetical protein